MSSVTATVTLQEFRRRAIAWLASRLEPRRTETSTWGVGPESVAVFHDLGLDEARRLDAELRKWHVAKLDAGWAGITWPVEFGGLGLDPEYDRVFHEEQSRFVTPVEHEAFNVTLELVAPVIQMYGTDEQKQRFLPMFLRVEQLACQLFSEPEAGSDLASLRCRAQRTGDTWVIDGQKVWTSGAQLADYGLLIARSDPAAPQHRGMTAFMVPLDAPGVEIRPIRQMTGGASFNEVFLNGVCLGDDMRLGAEGDGWKVALSTLGFERSSSAGGAGGAGGSWSQVLTLVRHLGADHHPIVRQSVAALYTMFRIEELSNERAAAVLRAGQQPGPLGSVGKLFWTQRLAHTSDLVSRVLGPHLVADTGEWGTYAWGEHVLGAPGYRIAGGSDEIQRNIIGERVLGLPREPRPKENNA
ncbi:MAG: hypothetical protein RL219_470 [Actinomycetota bacterium]